ncbi:TetR/AcrR family transcriptional regulator [Nocardia bovistercoris]|uniref:TetR/AcrR family transcriptional regulator n=1 Tax=Nocardia bovistercoris TaxID=2785916 RepID=A0A931I857_9NOCA|nr:TetR/AcrR family transcriptional regulator [Nocardia bovistercoris]MBH0775635.1 TetR/AcrR family transcriptional regulator [Nocardia bovistercoris]
MPNPAGSDRAGRTLRDEQKSRTRAALIDSARAMFGRQGYAAVRVDDIAAAVGCSRATFYLHFSGKPEVLRALADRTVVPKVLELCADLDRVLATDSRDEFAGWVARTVSWFDDFKDLLPAWNEAMALDPGFREIAHEGVRALPDAMPTYLRRRPPQDRAEARLRLELFVAQLERFFTRWAVPGVVEVSPERAVEVLTDIWHPALRMRS